MKKALLFSGLACMLAFLTVSCGAFDTVNVTQATGVDFRNSFHTFQWLPDKGDTLNTAYNNEIIRDNIRKAVKSEFLTRNVVLAPEQNQADLLLQLVVQNNDRAFDNTRYNPGFYFGPFGSTYSTNRSYYAHTRLTVNMYDHKSSRLVWSCTAEGDLTRVKDFAKNIQPAVAKIMKKYPVPALQAQA